MTIQTATTQIGHTSFIGRDQEIAEVIARFDGGERFERAARLVTLVGPGGVGKTRLARAIAAELAASEAFRVQEVTLETIHEARLVLPAIAAAFGISETLDEAQIPERLKDVVGDAPTLLLLDNCEHVIESARGIAALIDANPALTVLATSRHPLLIEAEQVLVVDPLRLPVVSSETPEAELRTNPAVLLFIDRGQAAGGTIGTGDLRVVAEIVRLLDGLPLAIELAAARLWQFRTPSALLEELDPILLVLNQGRRDASPRHATMHAAIAWSYELLSPEEQQLFRRLSVCVGGFNLELAGRLHRGRPAGKAYPHCDGYGPPQFAVERFGGDPYLIEGVGYDRPLAVELKPIALDLEAGITALADQNLIYRQEAGGENRRYAMLETIRAFGQEQLALSDDEAAVRHAHAAAMIGLADVLGWNAWTTEQAEIFRAVDADFGNLRSAIVWADGQDAPGAEIVIRIVDPLWHYLQVRGLLDDVREWLGKAVKQPSVPPLPRALGYSWLPLIYWIRGDDATSERYAQDALAVARERDYGNAEGRVRIAAAAIAWSRGHVDEMGGHISRALECFQDWDDFLGVAISMFLRGQLERLTGRRAEARASLEQAYEIAGGIGFNWGMATARYYAGEVMRDLGQNKEAAALLLEALERYWAQLDGWGTGSVVSAAATMAAGTKEVRLAARLFGAAHTLLIRAGAFLPPTELDAYKSAELRVRGRLGAEEFTELWTAGRTLAADAGVQEARAYLVSVFTGEFLQPASRPAPIAVPDNLPALPPISAKQREVVRLLVAGKTTGEIARHLKIKKGGVYYHIGKIREKWKVSSVADIVRRAILPGEYTE